MAFLRVKHIRGSDYLYLVCNHRQGDKVFQDIIEYRGRVGGTTEARAPYNTLRRQFHPEECGISTTKEPLFKGNAPFHPKIAKQTSAENGSQNPTVNLPQAGRSKKEGLLMFT